MSRGRRISRVKYKIPSEKISKRYLREWDSKTLFHFPERFPELNRSELFNRSGPICIDIGCGTGEFTNALAVENPDQDFLGIEISRRAIYYAVHQAARLHLKNILFIKADFKLLGPLFSQNSLLNVYLNFPDPNYGGENRRKHRIFTSSFLDLMHNALTPDGTVQVVTDQKAFLIDMLEIAESDPRFAKTHPERFLESFSPPEKTRFQIAWEKFERPVYRFILTKDL